jgi:hypothetical protein
MKVRDVVPRGRGKGVEKSEERARRVDGECAAAAEAEAARKTKQENAEHRSGQGAQNKYNVVLGESK